MVREEHFHLPKGRMSRGSAHRALETILIGKITDNSEQIAQHFMNRRKGGPASRTLKAHVVYPEAGVIRTYLGGNVQGWVDEVLTKEKFRPEGQQNAH